MPENPGRQWLHLFTSNIRDLYVSDAIDLLAAPEGIHYRFRYESKYISEEARVLWEDGRVLQGYPVAIYFSLQHPANFHPAAFVPLREGRIVRTLVEGSTYVVYFRVARYLPLADRPQSSSDDRAKAVRQYSMSLRELLDGCYPDNGVHAAVGASPEALLTPTDNAGRDFETLVRYLTPSVPVRWRTFFRVAFIEKSSGVRVNADENGIFPLVAGAEYVLNVAHYHHEPLAEPAKITLVAPDALTVVGGEEITIRSRYDLIPIKLFTLSRENTISDEISLKTVEPALGPTVRLPLVIRPATSVALFGPALGFGTASAIALPPIFANGQNLVLRIAFAVLGAVAVALGLWWRRSRGLST